MFKILKTSTKSRARLGILKTAHGAIKTPFFMPVATQGVVKTLSTAEMKKINADILLANTYHLMLQPGEKLIKKAGGLHKFMDWHKPILTDSGGFQIFSLAGGKFHALHDCSARSCNGQGLVQLSREGVKIKSYIDGKEFYLTPEKSLKIQADLGVDIAVCLDECVALPADRKYLKNSVELTSYWAKKTKNYYKRLKRKPLLFAVIQGGLDKDLRLRSLRDLIKIGFDGYNIGGLSVGETRREMYNVLDFLVKEIPEDKPRYLMGVGYPENIIAAVKQGCDMFDCVIPTREGRHGRLFIKNNNLKYQTINITRSKFAADFSPINKNSKIYELKNYTKAYLYYLFKIKEPLGLRLASINNLEFYLNFMAEIREKIKINTL